MPTLRAELEADGSAAGRAALADYLQEQSFVRLYRPCNYRRKEGGEGGERTHPAVPVYLLARFDGARLTWFGAYGSPRGRRAHCSGSCPRSDWREFLPQMSPCRGYSAADVERIFTLCADRWGELPSDDDLAFLRGLPFTTGKRPAWAPTEHRQ